ncbi:hypothetical protein LPB136_10595 [Tenacibaculum todarodis]|uniref:Lipoprotein n=1 Tax=Tenacibaculum todarodis TaxID=1850252 RepID=A0A1L3JKW5_9FLAO|nr:hypothetical protein [Tenacibaculum todarodis]APG65785.1 hypothetical protein LPB136_10595 [Tenacibaculum todarodis]
MKLFSLFAVIATLFQCASLKFEDNPPFKINSATFKNYVGGMPGVSGTNVVINYETSTTVNFDSLFFKGRKAKIELETSGKKNYIKGHFNTSTVNSKEDLVLHKDGKKEYGNKVPEKKFPFELKESEAVISYLENGETKFFKVENIKKGEEIFYPSAKPRK